MDKSLNLDSSIKRSHQEISCGHLIMFVYNFVLKWVRAKVSLGDTTSHHIFILLNSSNLKNIYNKHLNKIFHYYFLMSTLSDFFQIMQLKILKAIHQAFFCHPITGIKPWSMAHPKTFHKFSQSLSNSILQS